MYVAVVVAASVVVVAVAVAVAIVVVLPSSVKFLVFFVSRTIIILGKYQPNRHYTPTVTIQKCIQVDTIRQKLHKIVITILQFAVMVRQFA